nr:DNA replication factor Dna2-like nuclease [uncultured Mediterranean phage uvMED]
MTITALPLRPCELRESDHKYVWLPTGEEMAVSVTGVISHGKPPVDYSRWPEAAPRGTHVHRCMEALVTGKTMPPSTSPEGIDCSDWFKQLQGMKFWDHIDLIAAEYTMCHTRKSLGGQLDLLCRYTSPKTGKTTTELIDLKTKSASWKAPSKEDIQAYEAQAGGYGMLLDSGNEAHGGCWIDAARILVITPNQVKWLPAMDPKDCSFAWEDCWDRYSVYLTANPF